MTLRTRSRWLGLFALCLAAARLAAASSTNAVIWHAPDRTLEARVHALPLPAVLSRLAATTGWKVFVETNTDRVVSATFPRRPQSEALRLLLDGLNFAVLPQTNGPTRLLVYRTSADHATQRIPALTDPAAHALPNERIVRLKPGVDPEAFARRVGAKILGRADGQRAYRLQFADEQAADRIGNDVDVDSVEFNYPVETPTRMDASGGAGSGGLNLRPNTDASRLVVGLIDSAPQLSSSTANDLLLPTIRLAGDGSPAGDLPSHGTGMAETILQGLARNNGGEATTPVRILPVDIYGGQENTTTFDVALGIHVAVNSGATIINLSLGSDVDSPYLHAVIQEAQRNGVIFLAAAGNDGGTLANYPAAYPEVIAVTAGDRQGRVASFANYGAFVDVIAPGNSVVQYNNNSFLFTGTSSATAYASGTAAAILSANRGRPAAEIQALLQQQLAAPPAPRP